jgi:hypothetical protein
MLHPPWPERNMSFPGQAGRGLLLPRGRRSKWILAAALVLLLAAVLVISLRILRIGREVSAGRAHLAAALAAVSGTSLSEIHLADLPELDRQLGEAETSFQRARADLAPFQPLLNILRGDAKAAPALLDLALEATRSGRSLYASLAPMLTEFSASDGLSLSDTRALVERAISLFQAAQPALQDAHSHLEKAADLNQQIDRASLSDPLVDELDRLDRFLPRLQSLSESLTVMPDLLGELFGLQAQKVYLVLSQNNDELRPLGGWIGTYGLVRMKAGRLAGYEYHSNTPPTPTPPDEPCPARSPDWWLQLQEPVWGCWDAHWTADFPTLAQQSEWFYTQGGDPYAPVDGVVAVDLTFTGQLLQALGPVLVPEYGETVSAANLRQRIYAYRAREGEEPHKKFIASLFTALLARLTQADSSQARAVFKALLSAVQEKHLLVYFNAPGLESLAASLGADGGIRSSAGDYLYVLDSSLTCKAYHSIRESIEYSVTLQAGLSATAVVTTAWYFPTEALQTDPALSSEDWSGRNKAPFFTDIARLYLPAQAIWSGTDGNTYPTSFDSELDRQMLANLVKLAPGAGAQIRQRYLLPGVVQQAGARSYYRLLVQKQPGTQANALTVIITLPAGVELLSASPKPASITAGEQTVLHYQTRLSADRSFEIVYR